MSISAVGPAQFAQLPQSPLDPNWQLLAQNKNDFKPSGDRELQYIGLDIAPKGSDRATPFQLAFGSSNGSLAVKTARGEVYVIESYIVGQINRYINPKDGSFNKGALRELLQQLVNNKTIRLDQQDLRRNPVQVIQIGQIPYVLPPKGGGPSGTAAASDTNEQVGKFHWDLICKMFDIGSIVYGGAQLKGAIQTYKALSAARAAGTVLSPVQNQALIKSQASLTAYWVGAMAGGTSYGLFIKEKHWDEAYSALAAGKPLDALSAGGKAAMTLLNWTLVTGSVSDSLAQKNVQFGKFLMERTLGLGKLKGMNWGMFIDPKAWNAANITRVMGADKGAQIIAKYRPVLAELNALTAAGQPVVTATGKLRVSPEAVRTAGFDSLEALVKSMSADGFWRVFTSKPVLNSPFVFAAGSGTGGTINSYFQLGASRALAGGGASLALQSLNSLGVNGSLNINWNQAIAGMFGGAIRSTGAPGAWAGKFAQRLGAYTMSSTGAFFGQWWAKGILEARGKTQEKYSGEQLKTFGNANQAALGVAMLLTAYKDAGVEPPKELFNNSKERGIGAVYVERLKGVMAAADEKQMKTLAVALDTWLDQPIAANGLTRRQRLEQVSIPRPLAERMQQVTEMRTKYRTGTMADVGIAPRFSGAAR